jgi:hypothetical protein
MIPLNLPAFEYKIKGEGSKSSIFDPIRRKYVALTPEEWVRQHFINFLHKEKAYPYSLMKVEGGLKYNSQAKRADIVIFNTSGIASVVVECKAPEVKINTEVFEQAARYNMELKAKYIIVTNGIGHYCCSMDYVLGAFAFLDNIPDFSAL